MDVKITNLDEKTWVIDEGGVRFFLLEGDDSALLIDSGMMVHNARDIAASLTDKPIKLLNTHADPDHLGSVDQFEEFYMHPAEASNYYNSQRRKQGRMIPVWDGENLDLGNRPLEIIAIPGHTPGSIGILDVKRKLLFSGDPIQDGGIFMFGVQREMHAYIAGLSRVYDMRDRFDQIIPSHGSYPLKADIIPKLIDGANRVIAGEIEGEKADFYGQPFCKYFVGVAAFLYDGNL